MNLHWPQWVWIGMAAINLLLYAAKDGQPRSGTYQLSVAMLGTAFSAWLLWCGGFFA